MAKRGRADARTNFFVEQDDTDAKVHQVLAPAPDTVTREKLTLRRHELSFSDSCQNGHYGFSFIRVQWNQNRNNNRLYSMWARIGGEEFVRLGDFHTNKLHDHADFPCTARWEKDDLVVRIYQGDPAVPEPPEGKRLAKKAK